jgi:hypothetical protein
MRQSDNQRHREKAFDSGCSSDFDQRAGDAQFDIAAESTSNLNTDECQKGTYVYD